MTWERIAEAEVLLSASPPRPSGAYYLAGYAVECALKVCICDQFQALQWPEKKFVMDCHTHDLKSLIRLAKLEDDLNNEIKSNVVFKDNWLVVQKWNEQSRYEIIAMTRAVLLIDAATDKTDGVLTWIMSRW